VAVAGSAMHFLIALVVLFSMFFWTGDNGNYLPSSAVPASAPITAIDGLTTGASPAQQAGFHLGDRIVAVDGRHFTSWTQLTAYLDARPGRAVAITVQRSGHHVVLDAVPIDRAKAHLAADPNASLTGSGTPPGFLGIEADQVVHTGIGAAVSHTGGAWVHVSALTVHALARLVTFHGISDYAHMLTSQKAADSTSQGSVRFASPVKVVQLFHQAGQDGLATVLWLLAVINLSLGIFNLIPLLPLDGGHVAIAAYEGVRSRIRGRRYQADVNKLVPLFYVALFAIAFLGLSSLFLDIRDLVA
jgi:RIP metalloprotease RseP